MKFVGVLEPVLFPGEMTDKSEFGRILCLCLVQSTKEWQTQIRQIALRSFAMLSLSQQEDFIMGYSSDSYKS